jgi:uncharacterized protein YfaS (alpha-2-macroglobulin family)
MDAPAKSSSPPSRDRRGLVIFALAVALAGMTVFAFRDSFAGVSGFLKGLGSGARVVEVKTDLENRRFVDFLFDQPVGEGREGQVLAEAPAAVDPALAGVWRFQDAAVLRFEPAGGLGMASRYEITLDSEKLGRRVAGERTFVVQTDSFLLETVEVFEEPTDRAGEVTLRGNLTFNYEVEPEQLAPQIRLLDPGSSQSVTVEIESSWQDESIGFVTSALQKSKDERKLTLVIGGALTPADGNVPLGEDVHHEVLLGSSEKLAVRTMKGLPDLGESSIEIVFSSPVAADTVARHVRVEPEVKYTLSAQRNVLTLTGDFRPGESYTVALATGLTASDGARLPEGVEREVDLANLEPSVDFQGEGMFLSRTGYHTIALDTVNVDRVDLAVDRVYKNNLFYLLQYGSVFSRGYSWGASSVQWSLGNRIAEETVALASRPNQLVTTPLRLDPYIDDKGPGLFRVLASRPGEYRAAERWLLLTDLGVVAKRSAGELLVWVSSVRDLSVAAGARVTLLSDQNQTIASGTTDGQGLWQLGRLPTNEARPYLIVVEKGADFTFLLFDQMGVDTTGLDVGGASLAAGYQAFLYGERDLYRPGETIHGLAVVRDESLSAPSEMPAVVRHLDPEGQELDSWQVRLDERGQADLEMDLAESAPTGSHSLDLLLGDEVVGSWSFQVEEFVPDRIKVTLDRPADAPAPERGGELGYTVLSNYLFGPPAAGLAYETRVRLEEATFGPEGFETFAFENSERAFERREILETRGNLTAEGTAAVTVPLPTDLDAPSSLRAVVTARVQEQGGRGVSARAAYPVHPWPRYVGLRRAGDGWAEPGKDETFELAVVAPDGTATTAPSLVAELFEVRWNTVLRRTEEGGFRYETTRNSERVASQNLAGGSRGTFKFKVGRPGSYRVVVTDPTGRASSAVSFYASGWGYAPWAVENPNRLELGLDKDEYAPGDVAVVQVRAPFAGKLLVTVERNEVYWAEIHTLAGNTASIQIPIRGEFRPNAFVTATLMRAVGDLTAGSAGRAFGAVPLPVDRTANRLEPVIEAPEESRSAREVTVAVKTEPGATVTLSAVDEGILQLIGQQVPEPFDFFYRQLGLTVSTFDTFQFLLPEVNPVGTAKAGGGDGLMAQGASLRTESLRRVEPVSFWSGPLQADATGRATYRIQLPDEFQGSLRWTAVAVDGKRFGSSRDDTRVRDPLVLLPTAPRVLSFGEELSVPVTVRNDTGKTGTFRVGLGIEGPATVKEAGTDVEVPNAAERTVYLGLTTGDASGALRLRITAEGNGERARATVAVPVRPDLPLAAEARAVAVDGRSTAIPLIAPERYRPDTIRREVRIGTLPLVQFSGQLANLLRYPYGCLEQTVSTAFPLLYVGDLARQLEPDLLDPAKDHPDPDVLVAEAIRKVALHQTYDGDFTLWPEMERPQLWASVYATHFLVEAKRAGHEVPGGLLEDALEAVARKIQSKDTYGRTELVRTAYGLFVLARAGRPELGTMDYLREKQAAALTPESKALLAAAYGAAGNPAAPRQLLASLGELETIERQTGENFDSTLRNRALLTLAYLDADPKSPELPRLVDRLAREAAGVSGWWTTQETAWVFLALGQFAQGQVAKGPFAGTLWSGDQNLGRFSSVKPAAFVDIAGTAPLKLEMDAGYPAGAAYASVLVRGVPTDAAYSPASAGLEVTREVRDRDGRVVDLDAVAQGDLLVIKTSVRSVVGPVENVAIVNLLPSGLEVENPRLETTESLPWVTDANLQPDSTDLRDDRIVLFTDLPGGEWRTFYALVRAVSPGKFRLPPVLAEAMYNPALFASGERGTVEVQVRK